MVAVDILKVPLSYHNNQYSLVIQDYFTKWADAIPMPDQTAPRITRELVKLFATMGFPKMVHSDQGTNFESTILVQTLEAFGVSKSRTTAYHPQGDGMVERFNRSLLQLFRTYTSRQADWEQHLPLVLYAYRSAVHSSIGVAPFQLMFGRSQGQNILLVNTAYDPGTYQAHLQAQLARCQDFVESQLVESAAAYKDAYDSHSKHRTFESGDLVWLSVPTARKLDPRWEGGWRVTSFKGKVNVEIADGKRNKVVHVNRL